MVHDLRTHLAIQTPQTCAQAQLTQHAPGPAAQPQGMKNESGLFDLARMVGRVGASGNVDLEARITRRLRQMQAVQAEIPRHVDHVEEHRPPRRHPQER